MQSLETPTNPAPSISPVSSPPQKKSKTSQNTAKPTVTILEHGQVPVSTVFPVETSPNEQKIRCDFKCCIKCRDEKTTHWVDNTAEGVEELEKHVSSEIDRFMQFTLGRTAGVPSISPMISAVSLIVLLLELDDEQCSVTRWLPPITIGALANDPPSCNPFLIFRFASRQELLQTIWTLSDRLSAFTGHVLVLLSTHASNQGQVLACTPASIVQVHSFEEFCSLRDFVVVCQEAFGSKLFGIYLSSCFILRMDSSHQEWPVGIEWLDQELNCNVVGSSGEVYFTGQDSSDLHFVLASLEAFKQSPNSKLPKLSSIFRRASRKLFPDLVQEMGLTMLHPPRLRDLFPVDEPTVTHVTHCISLLCVYILFSPASELLALSCQRLMQLRKDYYVDTWAFPSNTEMPAPPLGKKLFLIVLNWFPKEEEDEKQEKEFRQLAGQAFKFANSTSMYGMHIGFCDPDFLDELAGCTFPVSIFNEADTTPPASVSLPLLVYMIQLATGENAYKNTEDLSSKNWDLPDVVTECLHVLPGMCSKCELALIHKPSCCASVGEKSAHFTRKKKLEFTTLSGLGKPLSPSSPSDVTAKQKKKVTKKIKKATNQIEEEQNDGILLSANISEVRVTHFDLHLDIDFVSRVISGIITFDCIALQEDIRKIVFDCEGLDFVHVEAVASPPYALQYFASPHSICIRLPDGFSWPCRIRILYNTRPHGASLQWCNDTAGFPAVFTFGASCNNRSLFPAPDAPTEMCTYTAHVTVPCEYVVLMSSQLLGYEKAVFPNKEAVTFTYRLQTPLMYSTLVLAAGHFAYVELQDNAPVPITLWGAQHQLAEARDKLHNLLPQYLSAAVELLGPIPFTRYDVLIMPPGFSSLGMQNPGLAFISESLLAGDGGMRCRIAHEIAHLYFGLSIGVYSIIVLEILTRQAKDWNEEWLSEGFATIVFLAEKVPLPQQRLLNRWELRLRTLRNDIENTDEDNQRLLPACGTNTSRALDTSRRCHTIHYIKSYFLLHVLAQKAGDCVVFDRFLKLYAQKFQNTLVSGHDFLDYYFAVFPMVMIPGVFDSDAVLTSWINSSGVPEDSLKWLLSSAGCGVQENPLLFETTQLQKTVVYLNQVDTKIIDNTAEMLVERASKEWNSDQLCLFLDILVQGTELGPFVMSLLQKTFLFKHRNAEINHRWAELIIKNRYKPGYDEVEQFMLKHQSMGLYVFCEMLCAGTEERAIALHTFELKRSGMDQELLQRCVHIISITEKSKR